MLIFSDQKEAGKSGVCWNGLSLLQPRLKREGSALNVGMTDQEKNKLYIEMMRQQSAHNRRLSQAKRRYADQLKQRLERIKDRRHADAQELFWKAQRERSNLEKAQQVLMSRRCIR